MPATIAVLDGQPRVGLGADDLELLAPMRADSSAEVAAVMAAKWSLGLSGGLIVANPIPASDEIVGDPCVRGHQTVGLDGLVAIGRCLRRCQSRA